MKKIITLAAIAVLSFNFVSCRQEDDSTDYNSGTTQEKISFGKISDSVKTDTIKAKARPVDPDPPVKDGTSW